MRTSITRITSASRSRPAANHRDDDSGFVLAHIFETHDLWHVLTGWGNDEFGEFGLTGVYLGQLPNLQLGAMLLAIGLVNTVFRNPSTLPDRIAAFTLGYQMGRSAAPLLGLDWAALWDVPIEDARARLRIDRQPVVLGRGVQIAA